MQIRTVACVGAGLIGQGWATLFSSRGLAVNLHDVSEDILKNAVDRIRSNLLFLERKDSLMKGEVEAALGRIHTTTDMEEAVGAADYVQESVPDNYEAKKMVFSELDAAAPEKAILASSSSGLLMTEIQKATRKPERCVLVHPMLPVHLMPLVEIVGGEETSTEITSATNDFMIELGKTPVVLNKEVPGFIVNRLQAALWREAVSLVANGVASAEDVDRAFCLGIGIRDPLLGPCLRVHIAGGGIERFIENYGRSYTSRWRTMETWTSIPPVAAEKIIESVKEMKVVRTRSLEEIERMRDEKLIEVLRLVTPNHPFY
jgi:3-hydroxypropionate dehydrogenase (NADP+)